jgi:hypothetical protein
MLAPKGLTDKSYLKFDKKQNIKLTRLRSVYACLVAQAEELGAQFSFTFLFLKNNKRILTEIEDVSVRVLWKTPYVFNT